MQVNETYDGHGNVARTVRFENELARALIEAGSKEVANKISAAILSFLKHNIGKFPEIVDDIKNILEEEPSNFIDICNAHKYFYEKIFSSQNIPKNTVSDEITSPKTVPTLRALVTEVINREDRKDTYSKLSKHVFKQARSDQFFLPYKRGRREVLYPDKNNKTKDFGITDTLHTQEWAKNYFTGEHPAAKNLYKAIDTTGTVKTFRRLKYPFISGPSGTISHILPKTVFHNLKLSLEEQREYIAILAASMIALGHHSVVEIMMVAAEFNLYYRPNNNGTVTLLKFPFTEVSTHIYSYFLPESFKTTPQFAQLVSAYPEYFSEKETYLAKQYTSP